MSEWVLVVEVAGVSGGSGVCCNVLQCTLQSTSYIDLYIYVGRVHIYIYGGIHEYIYILFAVSCSVYAVCCSVLQCVAPGYWDTLNLLFNVTQVVTMQSVAVCCSLLQSVAACGSVISTVSQVMTRKKHV